MDKKKVGYVLVIGMLLMNILPLISAYGFSFYDISQGPRDVIQIVQDFSSPFFEVLLNTSAYSEFFFAKVLMLLLLFFLITFVLKKVELFQNQKGIIVLIAAVVSILAMRFVSENDFTLGILLPYGTLGVTLTTIIPFALFFWIIQVSGVGGMGRRIAYIFYGIVFSALWASRYNSISPTMNQIYGWTLFLLVILLIFDKSIHGYFKIWELSGFYRGANNKTIAALQAEYLNIINVQSPAAAARRTAIEHQLTRLGSNLP